MSLVYLVLGVVALERLGELALTARNTRQLRAAGAIELDASAYPLFVLLHGAWLASMALFVPASAPASWVLLGIFAALQFGRIWVIASLGRYWTTRLIVLPDHPLIASGPYRFLRHPQLPDCDRRGRRPAARLWRDPHRDGVLGRQSGAHCAPDRDRKPGSGAASRRLSQNRLKRELSHSRNPAPRYWR
jgi:Isoprenylcysteine carboxyl methyltransferase (ICMT) family